MSTRSPASRSPRRSRAWNPVWSVAGLVLAYFSFPIRLGSVGVAVLELVLTLAGLVVVVRILVRELRHLRSGGATTSAGALLTLLALVVIGFAFAFFVVDRVDPGQVSGLHTRIDALYFTLSTISTVGFGDVHASGQVARAMVCALILFDVVILAALVRELTSSSWSGR